MSYKLSPLAPSEYPVLPMIPGVRFGSGRAGIRYKDRDDIVLMEFAKGTTVGGVFTTNHVIAAPVDWCKRAPIRSAPHRSNSARSAHNPALPRPSW